MKPKIGIFPKLLNPAKEAAERLSHDETLVELELENQPGFWVGYEDRVPAERVFHTFEFEGRSFVIFQ